MIDDTITVDGVTLTLSNAADINGSSFYVENGGKLTLPNVTAYSSTAYYPGSVFEASDSGSLLSLPSLATIYRNYGIQITATSGGVVDLGALTSLATAGAGSADTASFTATSGGAIELSSSLTQLTVVSIKVDGNGTLPLSQFTSITNSSIEAVAGTGTGATFSQLTDISGTSLSAYNGGKLTLPSLTSLTAASAGSTVDMSASGSGSILSLPELATITLSYNGRGNFLDVSAGNGGQVELPVLSTIQDAGGYAISFSADGTSSLINIGDLTTVTTNGYLTLSVTNLATVLDTDLTTLAGWAVTVDGTGTLPMAQWTSLVGSSLTVTGGSYTLTNLTDINGSSLLANSGSLTLKNLTSYSATSPNEYTGFAAYGGVVSLPDLGASVPNLDGVSGTSELLQRSQFLSLYGPGSVLDLASLQSITAQRPRETERHRLRDHRRSRPHDSGQRRRHPRRQHDRDGALDDASPTAS